jgi:predicted permease
MQAIARSLAERYPETNTNNGAVVVPLREEFVRDVRTSLWLLLAASLLVLFIACANVASMLLTRGIVRTREIAVRSALGASRRRVARQLFIEGFALSAMGSVLGVLIAIGAVRFLEILIPPTLAGAVQPSLDLRLLAFAAGATLLTGVIFGLTPLRTAFHFDFSQCFRGPAAVAGFRGRLRAALVSFETALAVVILATTGLIVRTILNIEAVDPGFRSESVLSLRLELPYTQYPTVERKVGFYREVLDRVRGLPGVVSAGFTTFLPQTNVQGANAVFVEGYEGKPDARSNPPILWRREVTAEYLETIRVPLHKGRWFAEQDDANRPLVAIISEGAANLFEGDPVGKRLRMGQDWFIVVGVVGDIREEGIAQPAQRPAVYTPANQIRQNWFFNPRDLAIRVQGDPTMIAQAVQREIWAINPNQTIARVQPLDAIRDQQTFERRAHASLLSTFSVLSVSLAALGIYALLTFLVEARKHEFGIRTAIGARMRDLVVPVFREAFSWIVVGVIGGLAFAMMVTRSLSTLLYGVEPTDPLTLSLSVLFLFAVGVVAACIPAWRAARVDPVIVLRHE